jgi:succinate dehydrogenase / fumarate reductase cytochrome b subunit
MSAAPRPRPKYYDLNLAHLPAAGLLSIFHRASGALLFFPILPLLLYALQVTLGSEEGYARWRDFFSQPLVKLVVLGAIWFYSHHFFAGIRYLFLDIHVAIGKSASRASALAVFAAGLAATLLIGWRLW